jgi:diguanylate cyclase (GGDEF)-like protein
MRTATRAAAGSVAKVVQRVDRLPVPAIRLLVAALLLAAGALDALTGHGEACTLLYLVPVTMAAYHASAGFAVAISFLSTAFCLVSRVAAADAPAGALTWIASGATRLVLYLLVTALLIALRRAFEDEKALARADPLTGAANVRRFHEAADAELARARRYGHPVTFAVLDVDDFKRVNDAMGHDAGDRLLREVATALRAVTREVDVVARIGGDEFAVLLPETGPEGARSAAAKIRDHLRREMRAGGWPVSFSIGVVTCLDPLERTDELLRRADRLGYEVKRSGKDSVRFEVAARKEALEPV